MNTLILLIVSAFVLGSALSGVTLLSYFKACFYNVKLAYLLGELFSLKNFILILDIPQNFFLEGIIAGVEMVRFYFSALLMVPLGNKIWGKLQ